MKSQHRHELQTNELGKVADKVASSLGGFFEVYGNRVMIAFCVVALAAAGLIYKLKLDRAHEAAAWKAFSRASRAEDFAGVWERHPGTVAGRWARVHEGESRLNDGIQLLFTNVESAMKELKLAREALQTAADQRDAPPEIRERALFGLARCLESMSDGSETDAVKTYQTLLREFPASIYKKTAEARIAALTSGAGQDFYAWFAKYPRPQREEKRPRDRAREDADSEMELSLPEEGDGKDAAASESNPSDAAVAGDKPASDSAPAGGEKSNPDSTLPAPDTKPEDQAEKPSAEPKSP